MLRTVVEGHRINDPRVKVVRDQLEEQNVRLQTQPLEIRKTTAAVNVYRYRMRRRQHDDASQTISNEAGSMRASNSETVCNLARARIPAHPKC